MIADVCTTCGEEVRLAAHDRIGILGPGTWFVHRVEPADHRVMLGVPMMDSPALKGAVVVEPEREPIPMIEVARRVAAKPEISRGANIVVNHAKSNGWEISVWYSRGPLLSADGRSAIRGGGVHDTIVVQGWTSGARFKALWVDGGVEYAYRWPTLSKVNVEELKAFIVEQGSKA